MRPTRRVLVGLAWSGFVAMATACGGGSGGSGTIAAPPDSCSVVDQNTFVQDVMLDIYLWADEVVPVDPATVGSPQEMLEVLRVPQDRFSFMQTIAADDAFFGSGQFVGLGFRTIATAADELRILDVFEDSVAENGGLAGNAWPAEHGEDGTDVTQGSNLQNQAADSTLEIERVAMNMPLFRILSKKLGGENKAECHSALHCPKLLRRYTLALSGQV